MDFRLEAILNSLGDAIIGVDDRSNLVLYNSAAARIFGAPRRNASAGPRTLCRLDAVIQQMGLEEPSGDPAKSIRRLSIRRGEATIPMEAVVSSVLLDGRTVRIAVVRDASFQQQMENVMCESRTTQALGSLAAGIAHDFNNILAAVISQIDLALHAPEFPSSLKDHLIYAQTSARRGAELVSKLQALSHRGKPAFDLVDPAELVEQTVFMLKRSIDPKIQILSPKPAANPWPVKADANQIIQALLNLAINARDAIPPSGGVITITMENVVVPSAEARPEKGRGEFLRLAVSDTGRGMTPDIASRAFDPYFSTKDLSRGPGLGLSITAAVVREHSGWMQVQSEPDRGSCFSIFLPRQAEPAPTRSAPAMSPDMKATEGKERILVVDDEELVRMVTKAVLAYRGYQVVEAVDGEDAVAKYSAAPGSFDLILMDQHMPRMNGYDTLQGIKQINPQAKAVMLSGGVHDPDAALGGMEKVSFLHKPFENQELLRLVRQLLDAP